MKGHNRGLCAAFSTLIILPTGAPPAAEGSELVNKKASRSDRRRLLLLTTVFIIAISGLAYELVAGTVATYLIGQSITQFSFATGWFLAAMGLGSYLSRYVRFRLIENLIYVQIFLSVLGGFSAAILFLLFAVSDTLYPVFMALALFIGSAVGFEIPIILRLVHRHRILSLAVSEVLAWDYLGALGASLLFPLVLLPNLGMIRTSLFFGLMNLAAAWIIFTLIEERRRRVLAVLITASVLLGSGFIFSGGFTRWVEGMMYQDPVVHAETTDYQRIVMTRWRGDLRLYLDGNLQFSSRDEARYHETLTHIPVALRGSIPENVLVLGAGDGIVIRELLKYHEVEKITLVELDRRMIELFKRHPALRRLTADALYSDKLEVIIGDAFKYAREAADENRKEFDLIIADLPDPNSYSLGKLYTVMFYRNLFRHLAPGGSFVTQATSPLFAPDAYFSIKKTIEEALRISGREQNVVPFHVYLPSFGDWGFLYTGPQPARKKIKLLTPDLRFLNNDIGPALFSFGADMKPLAEPVINRLNGQKLVGRYERAWRNWYN